MRNTSAHKFSLGVNTDVSPKELGSGYITEGLNIVGNRGAEFESLQAILGNEQIAYSLPPGGNYVCIGAEEDELNDRVVYFVCDRNDIYHHILEYKDGVVTYLAAGNWLAFTEGTPIHSVKLIDGKLYWCDPIPRKLNIDKSKGGKALVSEIHFASDSFDASRIWVLEITDYFGNNVVGPLDVYINPGAPTQYSVIEGLKAALAVYNVTLSYSWNSITRPAEYVTIEYDQPDHRVSVTQVSGAISVPVNHLPLILDSNQFSLIKPQPIASPEPSYIEDPDETGNRLHGFAYQFRYRFVFDDDEKSAWSAASYVPTNFDPVDQSNSREFTAIDVSFPDDYLYDDIWRIFIRKIEVCFRYWDGDIWRFEDSYEVRRLLVDDPKIRFTNSGNYPAVASDDVGASGIQSLKAFDFVPVFANTLETVYDESGNAVLCLGGCTEGYDLPGIEAVLSVIFDTRNLPTSGTQTTALKTLKSGGIYGVCAIFYDWAGRAEVTQLGKVEVPFDQQGVNDEYRYYLQVNLLSAPPAWASYWRIGITRNQNQSIYFQQPAFDSAFWAYDELSGEFVAKTYGDADIQYLGFELNARQLEALPEAGYIFDLIRENEQIFLPEPLDRIQVLKIQTGATTDPPSIGDIPTYNYPIAGYRTKTENTDEPKIDILVKYEDGMPNFPGAIATINTYYHCEIYRPQTGISDDIYYEVGRFSRVSGNKADPVDLSEFGDTYQVDTAFTEAVGAGFQQTVIPAVQRGSLYRGEANAMGDLGRAQAFDPGAKRRNDYDKIRTSDIYIPDTFASGLSSFRSLSYIRINRDYGPINKLILTGRNMLAVCEKKTQPIYVGKGRVLDLSGNEIVGRSSELLTLGNEFQASLGTQDPASVVEDNTYVYGYDQYRRVIWRYSAGSGQFDIGSYGISREIIDLASVQKVRGGIDRRHGLYVCTIGVQTFVFQEGIADVRPRWLGKHSYIGDYYCAKGLEFISFKDGNIWTHTSSIRANFYGVQYECGLTFVCNQEVEAVKLFESLSADVSAKIKAPLIETERSASYPEGMRSQLLTSKFFLYEGRQKADFLRDQTTPYKEFADIADPTERLTAALLRGRPIRGEMLKIQLRLDNPALGGVFSKAFINYAVSFSIP